VFISGENRVSTGGDTNTSGANISIGVSSIESISTENQQQHHHWMSLTEVFPARNGLTFNNMFKTKHLEKTLE
jgi:2-iminoacetate synthase ThiH